jgi:TfoX/Sxy family transcriptional regulator of competence genes
MAFDEGLAQRIRDCLHRRAGITEKKMFGGLAFMANGHMFVGVTGEFLMARVGPIEYEPALKKPHVREMDFTGKPMKGYVYVDAPALESDRELLRWVETCLHFVASLPPKAAKPRTAQRP